MLALWHKPDRRYRSRVAPMLFDWVTRTFESLLHPHLNRQRDFNIVLTDLIRDLRHDVGELRRELAQRAEGMALTRTPLFAWSMLVAASWALAFSRST